MKPIRTTLALAATVMLAACASPYHHRDRAEYDVYYDGYYGSYGGGYWGSDGYFYFHDGKGDYHRDDSRHFRRERFDHGSPYHSDPPRHPH